MSLPTYDGYFDAWLDRAHPGIEELAWEMRLRETHTCWPCGGSGIRDVFSRSGPRLEDGGHFTMEVCPHCQGSGLDIELGVAG